MAVFDPGEQRMCVRVVYDGAAGAGKTTNLRKLGDLFAAQRMTEVTSPAELNGRTLYFDWMQIATGVVCGFPLICQVISVPGQVAFTERRRHLLASADIVVYVCDSTRSGVDRARHSLDVIADLGRSADKVPPIVLQANKQDQVDVFDGPELAAALSRPELQVVEAIATEGIGVVDTFVAAVRTIARTLQARMEQDGLRIPVRPAPAMHQLLAQVARAPIDPFGAAELLLEEASAAATFTLTPIRAPSLVAVESAASGGVSSASNESHVPESRDLVRQSQEPRPELTAPLPTAEVPTGFIWPAHTGRATLRKLGQGGALSGNVGIIDPNGIDYVIADHVLATAPHARFVEPEAARQALVRAARERTQLGSLLVTDTVLVVQPASDGASWLWTVMPALETLDVWLGQGDLRPRVEAFAGALVEAAVVSVRRHLAFAPAVRGFGVQHGRVRYCGPIGVGDAEGGAAARLIHGVACEFPGGVQGSEIFAATVERELLRRLEPHEVQLIASATIPRRAEAGMAQELLGEAMSRLAATPRGPEAA